ncbi:Cullin binding-domain-containing protein [Thermoascus aurantiacus ATCC 26904]
MPPAYTSSQKQAISQFMSFTQAKEAVATKFLRSHGWNVEEAVDAYFQSPQGAASSGTTQALNKIFDSYRDAPEDNPDAIGIEGAMKFLGDIRVQLDEVACFGVAELLKSPSMGEFTREGFVEGWKTAGCDSIPKMIEYVAALRTRIPAQPDLFRRVYRYAFPLCRLQGQRNLQFDIATEQWRLFFTTKNGGIQWNTQTTPWLDWWIEFLEGRGKKPVNKDLWEQVEVFMRKTHEDENFGWWSADGAWPGALDDFVVWVQGKRGNRGEAMEVE